MQYYFRNTHHNGHRSTYINTQYKHADYLFTNNDVLHGAQIFTSYNIIYNVINGYHLYKKLIDVNAHVINMYYKHNVCILDTPSLVNQLTCIYNWY